LPPVVDGLHEGGLDVAFVVELHLSQIGGKQAGIYRRLYSEGGIKNETNTAEIVMSQ
jgi:hypothetical protein